MSTFANRKQFIEAQGATCRNWQWSWSFVNHTQKFVIFGAWDVETSGSETLILSRDWQYDEEHHLNRGFAQSQDHIGLIINEGYALKTFRMISGPERIAASGIRRPTIGDFVPELEDKKLVFRNGDFYAVQP